MIGERFDADAGLQFLNARYYDPKLAMFIQPDWWEVMQAGVGPNRYGYCSNDPTNCTDPSGHQDMPDISTDEDKEHFESCVSAGGCTSKLSYGEEMSNVCEAGGCLIVGIAATGGLGVLAAADLGVVSTAAALTLVHEDLLAASDGMPVSLGSSVGAKSGSRLLNSEGTVGTYDDLIYAGVKGDNITPHHIPSANRMELEGVRAGDGIAINMEHPFPGVGGRHRQTLTYGTQADISMSPRAALAVGVMDTRRIYQESGLYLPQIRSGLQSLIQMNKANYPTIFGK